MAFSTVLITAFECLWSPYLLERYRLDIYFIMGIVFYLLYGFVAEEGFRAEVGTGEWKKAAESLRRRNLRFQQILCILSVCSVFCAVLLFIRPNDSNYTELFPEAVAKFHKVFTMGLG